MPEPRPVRVWDILVSILLVLALFAAAATALLFAAFLPMTAHGCGQDCNIGQIEFWFILALALPVVAAVAATVITIIRLVQRRLAYWVPLAGIGGVVLGLLIGAAVIIGAIPNFF